jgi:hypothetical protein
MGRDQPPSEALATREATKESGVSQSQQFIPERFEDAKRQGRREWLARRRIETGGALLDMHETNGKPRLDRSFPLRSVPD